MKIESENNVFILNFNEELNKEEEIFLEVAKCMIEKKIGTKSMNEDVHKPVEVNIKLEAPQPTQSSLKTVNEKITVREVTQQPKQRYDSVKAFLESQDRKLVIGTCECEKDFHFWVDDPNQKEIRFTCKRCGEEKAISVEDLVPSTYECSECGKKSSFWMQAAQSVAISCVNCNAEVDMYYHDKKKIMTNEI